NACCDVRLYNIIVLGISFMLIFTAFQTCSMAEVDLYIQMYLGILYAVFAVSNWAAPSFVSVTGPKVAMFIGSLLYFIFVLSFLKPMVWALYLCSVLIGFGAAILWTGQGNYLTINSTSETVARNSGIFWALLQCSMLFGNMYSYFVFQGQSEISDSSRTKLFIALSAAGLLGCVCLLFLRKPRAPESENSMNVNRSFQLFKTREMLLLCFSFAYTGFELTFFSGVYGACISNNQHFGENSTSLMGISGIFIGVGEILGGMLFGILGQKTNKYGRDAVVLLGYVVHMVAFYLIFINMPAHAPIGETNGATYIQSNQYIAILCSFLLGFGDSSFNTQIFSLLGFMYPEDSSPAFALLKFTQSVAAAVAFYYSNVLILQWQLLINVLCGTLGLMGFCLVEWESSRAARAGYHSI
ncbi:hypothetical protein EGW08_011395, partial [Elysia chlorotica]